MAVTFRTGSGASGSGSTTCSLTIPTNVVLGDLMLVTALTYTSGGLSTPSGWTLIDSDAVGSLWSALYFRVAAGTDNNGATTVSFTGGSVASICAMAAYSGQAASGFINAHNFANNGNVGSTSYAAVGVTSTVANCLIVQVPQLFPSAGGTVTVTNSSGYTQDEAFQVSGSGALSFNSSLLASAGASGSVNFSSTVSSKWSSNVVAIAPLVAVVNPIPATQKAGHAPAFSPRVITRGRTFQGPLRAFTLAVGASPSILGTAKRPRFNPAVLGRGRVAMFPVVAPAPVVLTSTAPFVQRRRNTLWLPFPRTRIWAPVPRAPEFGIGFFQFLRAPVSRYGYGRGPVRSGRVFMPPITQQGTTGGGVLVVNFPGVPQASVGADIGYILIQAQPQPLTLSSGIIYSATPELIRAGLQSQWAAFLKASDQFSNPNMHYLITEYGTDGRYQRSYKVRVPAGATGVLKLKDVLI